MENLFGYEGKICVVTGAASGMGKATAEMLVKLGADVYALDVNPVEVEGIKEYIYVDLSEKESVDEAFTKVPEKIDCFFAIAGLRGATLPFMTVAKINLISNKYLLEEVLIDRFNENGAVCLVSSTAGIGYEKEGNHMFYKHVVETPTWEGACAALEATGLTRANGGLAYVYTKLAVTYMCAKLQGVYGPKHIRLNVVMPGDTATNFGSEDAVMNAELKETPLSPFAGHAGRAADAAEIANAIVFLNSKMASYISGANLYVDYGACGEIMIGTRNNPCGVSMADNFAKAQAARANQ